MFIFLNDLICLGLCSVVISCSALPLVAYLVFGIFVKRCGLECVTLATFNFLMPHNQKEQSENRTRIVFLKNPDIATRVYILGKSNLFFGTFKKKLTTYKSTIGNSYWYFKVSKPSGLAFFHSYPKVLFELFS